MLLGCAAEHNQWGLSSDQERDHALKAVGANFNSIQALIIQPMCVRCHYGDQAPHKIDLSSYEAIMNNNLFPPLIVRGNPDSSSFYKSIASGKMPKGERPLPPEAVQAIRDWILAGALKEETPPDNEPPDGNEPPD